MTNSDLFLMLRQTNNIFYNYICLINMINHNEIVVFYTFKSHIIDVLSHAPEQRKDESGEKVTVSTLRACPERKENIKYIEVVPSIIDRLRTKESNKRAIL